MMQGGAAVRKNCRHDLDIQADQLLSVLTLAQQVKQSPSRYVSALKSRYVCLLFEKPSLRTRLTFELAVKQLGGDCVTQTGPIAEREPLKDVARNLARWFDAIVARTYKQETIEELASWSGLPVINALSDLYHPCQALADFLTLKEHFGRLRGLKLAYVGDGNNVAHSLLLDAARLGVSCTVATPAGYEPKAEIVQRAIELAFQTGAQIEVTNDPLTAVRGVDAVYTDVWASMGQEAEALDRQRVFAPFQVSSALMQNAGSQARFMHCLPAKRGQEVTDQVVESGASLVFDQAENRLHAQKALLLALLP
jgi:ornithine carbamoyltransferase